MDFNEETDMFEYLMNTIRHSKHFDALVKAEQEKEEVLRELRMVQDELYGLEDELERMDKDTDEQ